MSDTALDPSGPAAPISYQPMRMAWPRRLQLGILATDTIVIGSALALAQSLRYGLSSISPRNDQFDTGQVMLGMLIGVVWLLALSATRSREVRLISVGLTEYQRVINATLWTFGGLAIAAYLARGSIARGYLAVALPVGLALLLLTRFAWRRELIALRRVGRCTTGAIVAGPFSDVKRTVMQLESNRKTGYSPIAVSITESDDSSDPVLAGLPRISLEQLVDTAKRTRTRAVMIAGNLPGGRERIRTLGWDLENCSAELILVSRLTDVAGPRMSLRPVEGLPMVHVDLPQYSGVSHALKRAVDVTVASGALLVLSPLLVGLAVAVRLTTPGPALFHQERVGLRGARFIMLKFRSMVVDAEARLDELVIRNEGNGLLFKLHDDPRVTPLGRFMRRYSLDELPQLLNVLRGDMSLVGPRPPLPREVDLYEARVGRRLLSKPGITGPWQVGGRSALSWEESVRLDLSYVENWSITGDLLILMRTVRAVIRKEGAY
jgi:exopolysaccharide biosynthesis polyprenyl glycosylphosphotransferase